MLFGKRSSLRMKGKVYKSYVRSAMLYGSERWCFRENDVAILKRARKIYGGGDVPCKVGGQEKYRRADEYVRIEIISI